MKNSITHYLQQDNKVLGKLLSQVSQLQTWNSWLKNCLEEDSLLPEHCFIVALSGTSLIVLADNPHWVTRFRFHIPMLIKKLRNYSDFEKIKSICCKVHPNYVPVSARKDRAPQQKMSAQSADFMRKTAEKISDEELRMILEKIAEHS